MDDSVSAAFLFAQQETLEDGSRWTAFVTEWDPYRYITLTMDVTLVHADGRVSSFAHGMTVPEGIGDKDREEVRASIAFACSHRAGIFLKNRRARETAER
jgi:hypothetical protein